MLHNERKKRPVRELFADAKNRAAHKNDFISCRLRGETPIGKRECKSCRGHSMKDVYPCELEKDGVVFDVDCVRCKRAEPGGRPFVDPVVSKRFEICKACPEISGAEAGRMYCRICKCTMPWVNRPSCVAGKWGVTRLSGCGHLREVSKKSPTGETYTGVVCDLKRNDCAECAEKKLAAEAKLTAIEKEIAALSKVAVNTPSKPTKPVTDEEASKAREAAKIAEAYRLEGLCNSTKIPDAKGNVLILSWGMPGVMFQISQAVGSMGYQPHIVVRGGFNKSKDWRREAIDYIEKNRPVYGFCWQRLFYGWGKEVKDAMDAVGCKLVVMDFAPAGLHHYQSVILDPKAENAESSIVGGFDDAMADAYERGFLLQRVSEVSEIARALTERAATASTQLDKLGLSEIPKDFHFFVGQRTKDKVLELDAIPSRRDIAKVTQSLIDVAASKGQFLVMKTHPQATKMDIPKRGSNHLIIDSSRFGEDNDRILAWLLVNAANTIVINSTVAYQTMALGKQVSTIGRGWFRGNHVANECRTLDDAFVMRKPNTKRQAQFVAWLLSRCILSKKIGSDTVAPLLDRFYGAKSMYNKQVERPKLSDAELYTEVYKQKWYNVRHPRDGAVLSEIRKLDAYTLLDVGCGAGHFIDMVLHDEDTKWMFRRVRGIDLATIDRKYDPSLFDVGTATALPYEDRSYDVVTCMDLLEHVKPEDVVKVLDELKRVSRKWVVLTVGIGSSSAVVHGQRHALHHSIWTVGQVYDLLRSNGLHVHRMNIIDQRKQQNVFVCEVPRAGQ